ncbi:MAG: thioredoxin domain-containing protein [Patescibacteria group bacterium]
MEDNSSKESKLFQNSNPKLVFVLGIVVGVGVFSLISLIILIGMAVSSDEEDAAVNTNSNTNTNQVADTNTAPTASAIDTSKIVIGDSEEVYGNADADITFVEFSDFQCPYCQKFHPTMEAFAEKNKDDIRWVFKHFPIKSHPQAKPAAIAAECANEQGKYIEYVAALFENQSSLADDYYSELASELGLVASTFETCLTSTEVETKVDNDYNMALSLGVTGTPNTIAYNSDGEAELIGGAVDEAYLESVLADLK